MLSVRLLGGLAVEWRDTPLPVFSGKIARSLFAYLLVHRDHAHTRDLLAGTFWPELPESVARRRLSQALWQIHDGLRAITPEAPSPLILAEGDTLQVNPDFPLHIDVDDFQHHVNQASSDGNNALAHDAAGVALYQGDFLEGYYDDWIVARREQLRLQLLESLARLVDGYKRAGDYEHALTYARRIVMEEPWDEAGHREVMRFYHLLGREAEALKQFEQCRAFLTAELNAAPAPETVALAREIAQRSDFEAVSDLPAAAPASFIFDGDRTPKLPLVGRETERAALLTHVEASMQGLAGLVLVEGEAGVGKTRLLQTLAHDAEWRGVTVLWGLGREVERTVPYGPLVSALDGGLTALRVEQLTQIVDEIWLRVLTTLLPTLVRLRPDLPPPPPLDPAQERPRLVTALVHLLAGWTQVAPLLLMLENLHWAGEDTLNLLVQVATAIAECGVLIIGSYRREAARARPETWERLQALDRCGSSHRLELSGLNVEATGELIRRCLGMAGPAPLFEARLYRETRGNPLFIIETLRALHSEGLLIRDESGQWGTPWDGTTQDYAELPLPQAVEQTIAGRLEALSPPVRQTLHLAAVLGERFGFDLLRAAAGIETRDLLATLRQLVQYRFLDETELDYCFSHDKVRQVAYEGITAPVRLQYHRQVAQALEALLPDQVEALAYHWMRAEVWEKAAACQRQAGDRARAVFANADAIAYYTQALETLDRLPDDIVQRYELLLSREAVYDLLGEREAQAKDLQNLSVLAVRQDSALLQARASLRQANYSHSIGDYPVALAAAQKAVLLAQVAQDPQLQAEGHRHYGRILWHQGNFDTARLWIEKALQLAQHYALHPVEMQCWCDLGTIAGQQGDHTRAKDCLVEALHICRGLGNRQAEGLILNNLGIVTRLQGNYDQARAYHEQSLCIRREIGDRRGESSVLNNLGIICRHQGDYTLAKMYFEQAIPIMRSIGDRWFQGRTENNLGTCLLNLGDYAGAGVNFEHTLQGSREIGDHSTEAVALEGLGVVCYCQGDHHLARERLLEALQIAGELGERDSEAYILTSLGAVLRELGQIERAIKMYQRAVDLRRDLDQPQHTLEPLAGLACVYLKAGDLIQACDCVDEILARLETNSAIGFEQPFQVYLTCYHVLCAQNDPRAEVVLSTAHTLLQERAVKIDDEVLRRSFLENVAANRELIAAYQAFQASLREKHITVRLPRADAPPGRSLRDDEYVAVTWTLAAPEDFSIQDRTARRRRQLLRLLGEAQTQGALPRDADLAEALDASLATVRRDMAALRAAGHVLPARRRKRTA